MRPTMLDLRRLEVEVEVLKTRPSLFFICRMDLNFTSFCRRKESEAWKAWEGKGNMKWAQGVWICYLSDWLVDIPICCYVCTHTWIHLDGRMEDGGMDEGEVWGRERIVDVRLKAEMFWKYVESKYEVGSKVKWGCSDGSSGCEVRLWGVVMLVRVSQLLLEGHMNYGGWKSVDGVGRWVESINSSSAGVDYLLRRRDPTW